MARHPVYLDILTIAGHPGSRDKALSGTCRRCGNVQEALEVHALEIQVRGLIKWFLDRSRSPIATYLFLLFVLVVGATS